jgi:hypothetical protein
VVVVVVVVVMTVIPSMMMMTILTPVVDPCVQAGQPAKEKTRKGYLGFKVRPP